MIIHMLKHILACFPEPFSLPFRQHFFEVTISLIATIIMTQFELLTSRGSCDNIKLTPSHLSMIHNKSHCGKGVTLCGKVKGTKQDNLRFQILWR